MPAIAGLCLDLAGDHPGAWSAQSAVGFTNTVGTGNFVLICSRLEMLRDSYPFGVYVDGNNYMLFNYASPTYTMYFEWVQSGTIRNIILINSTAANNQHFGSGGIGCALIRNSNTLRLGMLDFGAFSLTNSPDFKIATCGSALTTHSWDTLKTGRVQLDKYNTSQQGRTIYGDMILIKDTGSWTDAQIEAAVMNPSSIPDIIALSGGTIVHQWDKVQRSGVDLAVGGTTYTKVALSNNDVIKDSVGNADLVITSGAGLASVYPPFTPVGRYGANYGTLHNINLALGPLMVADPTGGYFGVKQTTDVSGMSRRWTTHYSSAGLPDRVPIPMPGIMSTFVDGLNTPSYVTGDIIILQAGCWVDNVYLMGPDYHSGLNIEFDGTNIIYNTRMHAITVVTQASPTSPLVGSRRYVQGAPWLGVAPASIGDVSAMKPTMSTLAKTLAGSGNTVGDYRELCATYCMSARVGNFVFTASRASNGTSGYLVLQKFSGGVEVARLKLTTNDLADSAPWPLAVVALSSNAFAVDFTLKNSATLLGTGTGLRRVICTNATTFDSTVFTGLTGNALTIPISQALMQTGPDTTNTDVGGYGSTPADCGESHSIGDEAGLIFSTWMHQVGSAAGYVAASALLKFAVHRNWNATFGFPNTYSRDITALLELELPGWRSVANMGQWSQPHAVWLNSGRTRAAILMPVANGATMVENGSSLGGCWFDDSSGTRIVAFVVTNLDSTPVVTYYGSLYTASGSILSVDIGRHNAHHYMPFLMLQAYIGPSGSGSIGAGNGLGQCVEVPVSLTAINNFAALVEGAGIGMDLRAQYRKIQKKNTQRHLARRR